VQWLQGIAFDILPIGASIFLAVTIVSIFVFLIAERDEQAKLFVLLFGLATLGAVSGVAGGGSRVGVVGDIIPAALGLAGGVSAYLFGVNQAKGLVASVCAAAFALALGFGYAAGAGNRSLSDVKEANIEFCRTLFSDSKTWADDKAFCRVVTSIGRECAWLFADGFSKIPELGSSTERKFQPVYDTIWNGMQARALALKGCDPVAGAPAQSAPTN
jgi:hypothetical protein